MKPSAGHRGCSSTGGGGGPMFIAIPIGAKNTADRVMITRMVNSDRIDTAFIWLPQVELFLDQLFNPRKQRHLGRLALDLYRVRVCKQSCGTLETGSGLHSRLFVRRVHQARGRRPAVRRTVEKM